MDSEAFLNRRADALMKRVGGMSLAEVVGGGDADALPAAARLVGTWLTRSLTRSEHVQAREVASRLGIDLLAFDQEQVNKEKHHA